jgi:hypothetical protein
MIKAICSPARLGGFCVQLSKKFRLSVQKSAKHNFCWVRSDPIPDPRITLEYDRQLAYCISQTLSLSTQTQSPRNPYIAAKPGRPRAV